MDRKMRIDVRGEAAGSPMGEHALLARRRRQAGDDCSQEPGVPVCSPRVERDDAAGHGVLDRGLEPLQRDPVDDPISDNISANVIGLVLSMLARFYLFRRVVFLRPEPEEAVRAVRPEVPTDPSTSDPARRPSS